jgi:hypothetical protein
MEAMVVLEAEEEGGVISEVLEDLEEEAVLAVPQVALEALQVEVVV